MTDQLDQVWLRLDDTRGRGVDLAHSLTAEAFSTMSVATSDLNLRQHEATPDAIHWL